MSPAASIDADVEAAGSAVELGDLRSPDHLAGLATTRRGHDRDPTGAIHVYGGDFVDQPRSQWGPGPIEERPYDLEDTRRQFAEANEAWRASSA
jgi:predicted metal-dependent enzyme (double-stranded beta helix superfamily)